MKARIYKPSKSAMQSGRSKTAGWVLEYESETARMPEPLMGWTASGDTMNQLRLKFPTMEEAVSYAEKSGLEFTIQPERKARIKPRNYGDNFKYIPAGEEGG